MRLFSIAIFLFCLIGINASASAQCVSAIPGLPDNAQSLPCDVPFEPNTPSEPADGPNSPLGLNEPKHDRDSCDADFMNQIFARSYLEANRELMISELLVVKPDSVLEYTCFDQKVRDTAEIAGPMFSESEFWFAPGGGVYSEVPNPGGTSVPVVAPFPVVLEDTYDTVIELTVFMGSLKLDISLDRIIMDSLNNFVNLNNFTHTFLGGTVGLDDTVAATVAEAEATCTHMSDVWQLAKCENINPATFFMTFTEIAAEDPRNTLPDDVMQCLDLNPITTRLIEIANNDDGVFAYKEETLTYLEFLDGGPETPECAPPIPTGLIVTQELLAYSTTAPPTVADTRTYRDYVCPNSGCFYSFTSGECLKTP